MPQEIPRRRLDKPDRELALERLGAGAVKQTKARADTKKARAKLVAKQEITDQLVASRQENLDLVLSDLCQRMESEELTGEELYEAVGEICHAIGSHAQVEFEQLEQLRAQLIPGQVIIEKIDRDRPVPTVTRIAQAPDGEQQVLPFWAKNIERQYNLGYGHQQLPVLSLYSWKHRDNGEPVEHLFSPRYTPNGYHNIDYAVGNMAVEQHLDEHLEEASLQARYGFGNFEETARLADNYATVGATDKAALCRQQAVKEAAKNVALSSPSSAAISYLQKHASDVLQERYDDCAQEFMKFRDLHEEFDAKHAIVFAKSFLEAGKDRIEYRQLPGWHKNQLILDFLSGLNKRGLELSAEKDEAANT